MNVINSGGWFVGNTAVLDWMDGFEEFSFIKGDFHISRLESGIMDMIATQNFEKKNEMISKNKVDCYLGAYKIVRNVVGRYTKNMFKSRQEPAYFLRPAYYRFFYKALCTYERNISSNDFDEVSFWRLWLNELASRLSAKGNFQYSVFQNPFFYDEMFDEHSDLWPKLFAPFKLVFVHRDPLDQFADIVLSGSHLDTSSPRFHGGTEHLHPADRFLEISKKIYKARLKIASETSTDDLIVFSFEDFLLNHDRVTSRICDFFKISTARDQNNRRFELNKSLKNIGNGKDNEIVSELLDGKDYVVRELEVWRERLSSLPHSIA
ncbi:sulfotransferase [uncultured Marinobacter sp.]|uniref:sulfotransferase n=1 Tax=uncultured Marinobacter sp. TaxID=187379 RepID=UPI00261AE43C|nr:sulfotransferase [uncultured Marinobacter sp.]